MEYNGINTKQLHIIPVSDASRTKVGAVSATSATSGNAGTPGSLAIEATASSLAVKATIDSGCTSWTKHWHHLASICCFLQISSISNAWKRYCYKLPIINMWWTSRSLWDMMVHDGTWWYMMVHDGTCSTCSIYTLYINISQLHREATQADFLDLQGRTPGEPFADLATKQNEQHVWLPFLGSLMNIAGNGNDENTTFHLRTNKDSHSQMVKDMCPKEFSLLIDMDEVRNTMSDTVYTFNIQAVGIYIWFKPTKTWHPEAFRKKKKKTYKKWYKKTTLKWAGLRSFHLGCHEDLPPPRPSRNDSPGRSRRPGWEKRWSSPSFPGQKGCRWLQFSNFRFMCTMKRYQTLSQNGKTSLDCGGNKLVL